MALRDEAKRVKFGNDLDQFQTQSTQAINILNGVKSNIDSTREALVREFGDPSDEVAEVDTVKTSIITAVKVFASAF